MHIAIEGMDGVGKTSQAKALSEALNFKYIEKAFHEMHDISGRYDNFITIQKFTDNHVGGNYGIRQNYYFKKIKDDNIITDRFYISDYWRKADRLSERYYQDIIKVWGNPDLIVILFARPDVLYNRLVKRNPNDKDLWKTEISTYGYELMFDFVKKMNYSALIIDTSEKKFEEVTEIIRCAIEHGIEWCKETHQKCCQVITPKTKTIVLDQGEIYLTSDGELFECRYDGEELDIPEGVCGISEKAFVNSPKLKRLNLSKSILEISDFAFERSCITEICVSNDNPRYYADRNFLYNKEQTEAIKYFSTDQKVVTVPEGTVTICCKAFAMNKSIEEIWLPSSIKKIEYGAFIGCANLKCLKIQSENIEIIQAGAFIDCKSLVEVEIRRQKNYYIEDSCIKEKNGNILYYFGNYNRGNVYNVPRCQYILPAAYMGRLKADSIIFHDDTVKIGSYAFEDCHFNCMRLGEKCEDFGERSFYNTNTREVRILSRKAPFFWENTFDNDVLLIVNDGMRNEFNRKCKRQNVIAEYICAKDDQELCGTSCVRYILKCENIFDPNLNNKACFWIMDLGNYFLKQYNWKVKMYYYQSTLIEDYKNNYICEGEYVRVALDAYIENGGRMYEKELTLVDLLKFRAKYKWLILLLRSEILFKNKNLTGNSHFVLLESLNLEEAVLVSPGKREVRRIFVKTELLLNAMKGNGQWLLCISY